MAKLPWFDDKDDIKTYVQGSRSSNRPHEMMEMRNTKTVPNTVQAETSATNKSKINPSVNVGLKFEFKFCFHLITPFLSLIAKNSFWLFEKKIELFADIKSEFFSEK